MFLVRRSSAKWLQHTVRTSMNISTRFQSTVTQQQISTYKDNLTDEEVTQWLDAINSLEKEFTSKPFLPEASLVSPGERKLNLLEESMTQKNEFVPTQSQIEEWETLKKVPIPRRCDDVLEHVTNMIMRHGKRQKAEKILSRSLYILFCQTREDPINILKDSLDKLAPLMVVRTFKTGVAKASVVPVPLNQRQRFRIAWKWIVEGANKRPSSDFSVRLGEELVSVYKGNSSGFAKRDSLHKTAIAHRAYIKLK